MLDGVDMNDAIDNLIAYQPSPDAVEQVSVETNNYSPELGNVAGAVVNMVIKSGTNRFSGNGFYYWRDNDMAATPWAINRAGGKKAEFNRKIFGGTIGGPIAQNKVFFFADYQGGRQKSPPADEFLTVIPDEWRRGDLSSLLNRATPIVVRDPQTGQPFPNNQIPTSRFSPFARNLLANEALYPRRQRHPRALTDFRQNYVGKVASSQEVNQFDGKVDWNASTNDKVYVRYSKQTPREHAGSHVDAAAVRLAVREPVLEHRRQLEPHHRHDAGQRPADRVQRQQLQRHAHRPERRRRSLNNQLGIGGTQPIPGLTEVRMGNDLTNIGTIAIGSNTANEVFQINERLTWVKGRHQFKFGGSWNHYNMERYYSGNNGQLGFIQYNGAFSGVAFADFLLDQVQSKGRGSLTEPWTHLQNRVAFYAADDFKVTNALTLNLGLRWGYTSPLVEQDDRQANFDLSNAELLPGRSRTATAARSTSRTTTAGSRASALAYRTGERWVFRGGYGITQYMEGTGANLRLPLNPPFFFESQSTYDQTSGPSTIATGFEGLQALDRPSGVVRAWDPNLRPQFTQQWNLFAEYLIGSRSSINIGYVGNKSSHLVTPIEGNQPLPGIGDPSTWAPLQQRRPLSPFNPAITDISTTAARGRSDYNALQTTFKQRLWNGLDFVANYTLSEAKSNNLGYYGSANVAAEGAYPVNSYDIEANYGPAFFDARHIISVAGSYELPFGKDRQYGNDWNRGIDAVAGGWSASFAVTRHTGYPITVQNSVRRSLQGTRSAEWPNLIGDPVPADQTLEHWINRDAFAIPALGTFGNAGVGILRAPGYFNADLSISKRFATFGRQYLQFRGEMFNVLNHPNFGPPNRDIQSTTFGTVTSTAADARIVQLVLKYFF